MKFSKENYALGIFAIPLVAILISLFLNESQSVVLYYISITVVSTAAVSSLLFAHILNIFKKKPEKMTYFGMMLLNLGLIVVSLSQVLVNEQPIVFEDYAARFIGNTVVSIVFIIMFSKDLLARIFIHYQHKMKRRITVIIPVVVFFLIAIWMILTFVSSVNLNKPSGWVLLSIFVTDIISLMLCVLYPSLVWTEKHLVPKLLVLIGKLVSIFADSMYGADIIYGFNLSLKFIYFFYLVQACFWLLSVVYLIFEKLPPPRFLDFTGEKKRFETIQKQASKLFGQLTLLSKFLRHDMNNDYAVIYRYLELYKDEGKEEYLNKAIDRLKRSAQRIREYMSSLLDITEVKGYSLKNMLDVLVYFPDVTVKGNADVKVKGNQILNLIIYNIVQNAYHHGGEAVEVEITIEEIFDHVILTISDNGKGMNNETMKNLFTKQIKKDPKDEHGLAMYLSKIYLDSIGASIRAEHNMPKGVKIIITLQKWQEKKEK
ncbi:MAG: sensor histidine kinase [Candidatus Heimdallarchaeaceae archaeon]